MKSVNIEYIMLKVFADSNIHPKSINPSVYMAIIKSIRQACIESLELAAENAKLQGRLDDTGEIMYVANIVYKPHPFDKFKDEWVELNKQSILNTINQIKP